MECSLFAIALNRFCTAQSVDADLYVTVKQRASVDTLGIEVDTSILILLRVALGAIGFSCGPKGSNCMSYALTVYRFAFDSTSVRTGAALRSAHSTPAFLDCDVSTAHGVAAFAI